MKRNHYLFIALISIFSIHAEWKEVPHMGWNAIEKLAIGDKNNIWAKAGKVSVESLDSGVYKWENNKWNGPQGDLIPDQLAIAQDNTVYAQKFWPFRQPSEAKIYEFNGTEWIPVHTFKERIERLFVTNKNDMWITKKVSSLNYKAFHWDGEKWEQKGTENIWEVYVGNDGTIIGKQVINYIDGNVVETIDWEKVPDKAKLSQTITMVRWNGTAWEKISTFDDKIVSDLAVIDKDNIWTVKGDALFELYPYQWNSKNKKWIKKGNKKPFGQLVAGRDGTVLMTEMTDHGYPYDKIYKWVEKRQTNKKSTFIAMRSPRKKVLK